MINTNDAYAKTFSDAVNKAMADFEAMTSDERAAHYEQQADEIHGKIEKWDGIGTYQDALRSMEKSLREAAQYYRDGGKTMQEYLTEEGL